MKIWGDNPRVSGIYNHTNPVGKVIRQNGIALKKDEFKISGLAKDYQAVMKALRNIPDIRQEKVQEISSKIDKGQYNVKARDISNKIIQMLSGKED